LLSGIHTCVCWQAIMAGFPGYTGWVSWIVCLVLLVGYPGSAGWLRCLSRLDLLTIYLHMFDILAGKAMFSSYAG